MDYQERINQLTYKQRDELREAFAYNYLYQEVGFQWALDFLTMLGFSNLKGWDGYGDGYYFGTQGFKIAYTAESVEYNTNQHLAKNQYPTKDEAYQKLETFLSQCEAENAADPTRKDNIQVIKEVSKQTAGGAEFIVTEVRCLSDILEADYKREILKKAVGSMTDKEINHVFNILNAKL